MVTQSVNKRFITSSEDESMKDMINGMTLCAVAF